MTSSIQEALDEFIIFGSHVKRFVTAYNGDDPNVGKGLTISLQVDEDGTSEMSRMFKAADIVRKLGEETLQLEYNTPEPVLPSTEGMKAKSQEEQFAITREFIRAAIQDMNLISGEIFVHLRDKWEPSNDSDEVLQKVQHDMASANALIADIGETKTTL